jgi:hypothetical protein
VILLLRPILVFVRDPGLQTSELVRNLLLLGVRLLASSLRRGVGALLVRGVLLSSLRLLTLVGGVSDALSVYLSLVADILCLRHRLVLGVASLFLLCGETGVGDRLMVAASLTVGADPL